MRKDKTKYYLDIAECVASRSTCIRRQYGAVIVKNDEIISTGYNGSPRGEANCCDVGECWRESNNIPHGEQYEKCVAVHAEQNAIISAPRSATFGAVLYLAGLEDGRVIDAAPCDICQRLIKNAGITTVISTRKHELAFDAPAVDAVEVVHGRWIWNEENECWVCSNCELSALNDYRGNSTDSNYCPNCGAKMDGGNDG